MGDGRLDLIKSMGFAPPPFTPGEDDDDDDRRREVDALTRYMRRVTRNRNLELGFDRREKKAARENAADGVGTGEEITKKHMRRMTSNRNSDLRFNRREEMAARENAEAVSTGEEVGEEPPKKHMRRMTSNRNSDLRFNRREQMGPQENAEAVSTAEKAGEQNTAKQHTRRLTNHKWHWEATNGVLTGDEYRKKRMRRMTDRTASEDAPEKYVAVSVPLHNLSVNT